MTGRADAEDLLSYLRLPDVPYLESGKLLATGGVSNLEGAGGGGISNWALITGYGTRDSIGGNAHFTYAPLSDFSVRETGAALGFFNRVELSYSHLWFDTGNTGAKLGLGQGFTFEQDVVGVKTRLFGDAVYDQDTWLPQFSAGVQYKTTNHAPILEAIGARGHDGVDLYLAATKLFLSESLLVNGTLRLTKANEIGILGFGGPRQDGYQPEFEGSIAYLLAKNIAVGAEYRTMPHNLGFSKESDWKTVYAAWFISKNASITVAYANLGTVATFKDQQGVYVSAQIGF
jgi:hypothetical protein